MCSESSTARVGEACGAKIIDDAAQSFGASFHGRPVGALAEMTATSFYPAKPLGCYGDGGAVLTDSDEMAARLRSLSRHGVDANGGDIERIGINGRMDTIQAAVLLQKLTQLLVGEGEHATVGVVNDQKLAGAQELVGDYQ